MFEAIGLGDTGTGQNVNAFFEVVMKMGPAFGLAGPKRCDFDKAERLIREDLPPEIAAENLAKLRKIHKDKLSNE